MFHVKPRSSKSRPQNMHVALTSMQHTVNQALMGRGQTEQIQSISRKPIYHLCFLTQPGAGLLQLLHFSETAQTFLGYFSALVLQAWVSVSQQHPLGPPACPSHRGMVAPVYSGYTKSSIKVRPWQGKHVRVSRQKKRQSHTHGFKHR